MFRNSKLLRAQVPANYLIAAKGTQRAFRSIRIGLCSTSSSPSSQSSSSSSSSSPPALQPSSSSFSILTMRDYNWLYIYECVSCMHTLMANQLFAKPPSFQSRCIVLSDYCNLLWHTFCKLSISPKFWFTSKRMLPLIRWHMKIQYLSKFHMGMCQEYQQLRKHGLILYIQMTNVVVPWCPHFDRSPTALGAPSKGHFECAPLGFSQWLGYYLDWLG